MKNLLYIITTIVLFFFAAVSNAYAGDDQFTHERFAFWLTWVIFGGIFLVSYLVWKRKSKTTIGQHAAKFRTKTYEIISHGKRMVITKRINATPVKK